MEDILLGVWGTSYFGVLRTSTIGPDTAGVFDQQKVLVLRLQHAVNERHRQVQLQVQALELLMATDLRTLVTTMGEMTTRRMWYLSADTGFAAATSINEVFPYIGSNIYFRPVNTAAPPGPFLSRFSALFGFTWTNNILKAGERKALYGESATLVLGVGMRLTEVLRVNGGGLLFKELNPNPLVDDPKLRVTPFLGVSADIDVARVFGGLFGSDATPPATIGSGVPPGK